MVLNPDLSCERNVVDTSTRPHVQTHSTESSSCVLAPGLCFWPEPCKKASVRRNEGLASHSSTISLTESHAYFVCVWEGSVNPGFTFCSTSEITLWCNAFLSNFCCNPIFSRRLFLRFFICEPCPLVAQIARCNRDVRCDSNWVAHPQIASDANKLVASDAQITRKRQQNLLRRSWDVGLRCERSACFFLRSSDAKRLQFGLPPFGLQCEAASARPVVSHRSIIIIIIIIITKIRHPF